MGNHSSRAYSTPIAILRGKKTTSSEKFEPFTALPDDLARKIFNDPYLSIKDKAALARTSQCYYGLFKEHIHAAKCLMLVAHGEVEAANNMLRLNPQFLLERCEVTDYSGRRFTNITPYEYCYWAKDTQMCRMLESHMDEVTKAKMLKRIDAIETYGLNYWQYDAPVMYSRHFDLSPLISTLKSHLEELLQTLANRRAGIPFDKNMLRVLRDTWMDVGIAQRDLPVHVVKQYCFNSDAPSTPAFNEEILLKDLTFYNFRNYRHEEESWFPLNISKYRGLGVDFAMVRGPHTIWRKAWSMHARWDDYEFGGHSNVTNVINYVGFDLRTIIDLDKIRTVDLARSRDNLLPAALGSGHSMRV